MSEKPEDIGMTVPTTVLCDAVQAAIDAVVEGDDLVAGYVVALVLRDGSCVTGSNALTPALSSIIHGASKDIAQAISAALMRSGH